MPGAIPNSGFETSNGAVIVRLKPVRTWVGRAFSLCQFRPHAPLNTVFA
jgi:hypothetical protein